MARIVGFRAPRVHYLPRHGFLPAPLGMLLSMLAIQPPSSSAPSIGQLLRDWRQRRRLSQLDLALEADISTRHLSFIETGRATPSRDMLTHLAERLEVPPRERNALFVTAGYAPIYPEHAWADPAMDAARRAVSLILQGHGHYPALAIDRHWHLMEANATAQAFMARIDPSLLQGGPINVLRLSLHPLGMAPHIVNLAQWRTHLFARLGQQIAASGDPVLVQLRDELMAYPMPPQEAPEPPGPDLAGIAVPLRYRTPSGQVVTMISTTTVFGTPVDITLSELALETFFPADEASADYLRIHHGTPGNGA